MSGQNKRARGPDAIENERAAFGSSTTTLPGPLKALVGGRFQPIIDLLAPLPAELQTTIIESTDLMLKLFDTISQRIESDKRFKNPVKVNNEVLTDGNGKSIQFVPNSLRKKCPIKPPDKHKNNARVLSLMADAEKDHESGKSKMTGHAESLSKLVIELDQEKLRRLVYNLLTNIARSFIGIRVITDDGLPDNIALSPEELSITLAHCSINLFTNDNAKALGLFGDNNSGGTVDAKAELVAEFIAVTDASLGVKVAEIVKKAKPSDEVSSDMLYAVADQHKVLKLICGVTIDHWKIIDEKNLQDKINAHLRVILAPPKIQNATQDVEMAMNDLDINNPSQMLLDIIDKRHKETFSKDQRRFEAEMRKKYSGGRKVQMPKPTANGRKSRKTSDDSTPPKKKKKKKKKSTQKKKVQFQSGDDDGNNSNQSTKKKKKHKKHHVGGGQGGANNGGRQNNAGRR